MPRMSPAGKEYGQVIPTLRLDHPTLRQALNTLAEQSHAKMDVDWKSIQKDVVDCDQPLNVDFTLRDVTLHQVLPLLFEFIGPHEQRTRVTSSGIIGDSIEYEVVDGTYCIASGPRLKHGRPALRIYDVTDIQNGCRQLKSGEFANLRVENRRSLISRCDDDEFLAVAVELYVCTRAAISVDSGAPAERYLPLSLPQYRHKFPPVWIGCDANSRTMKLCRHLRRGSNAEDDLAKTVDLAFENRPVLDALSSIRRETGATIIVHDELAKAVIEHDVRLSSTMRHFSLEEALNDVVAAIQHSDLSARWTGCRGLILLTNAADDSDDIFSQLYDVRDLAREDAKFVGKLKSLFNSDRSRAVLWADHLIVTGSLGDQYFAANYLRARRDGK